MNATSQHELDVATHRANTAMAEMLAAEFARDIANRICFLDAGVILETGPPEQMFSAPSNERTRRFLQSIIDAGRM